MGRDRGRGGGPFSEKTSGEGIASPGGVHRHDVARGYVKPGPVVDSMSAIRSVFDNQHAVEARLTDHRVHRFLEADLDACRNVAVLAHGYMMCAAGVHHGDQLDPVGHKDVAGGRDLKKVESLLSVENHCGSIDADGDVLGEVVQERLGHV